MWKKTWVENKTQISGKGGKKKFFLCPRLGKGGGVKKGGKGGERVSTEKNHKGEMEKSS